MQKAQVAKAGSGVKVIVLSLRPDDRSLLCRPNLHTFDPNASRVKSDNCRFDKKMGIGA